MVERQPDNIDVHVQNLQQEAYFKKDRETGAWYCTDKIEIETERRADELLRSPQATAVFMKGLREIKEKILSINPFQKSN